MDIGDKKDVKRIKLYQRLKQARLDAALKQQLNTKDGRELIWHWLERFGVFTSPMAAEQTLVFHNIGRQDAGREILSEVMRVAPASFALAMQEAEHDRYAAELAIDRDSDGADAPGSYYNDGDETDGAA